MTGVNPRGQRERKIDNKSSDQDHGTCNWSNHVTFSSTGLCCVAVEILEY
jgi:hypothetical protein